MKHVVAVIFFVFQVTLLGFSQDRIVEDVWRVTVEKGNRTVQESRDSLFLSLRASGLRLPVGVGEVARSRFFTMVTTGSVGIKVEYYVVVFAGPWATELEISARWIGPRNISSDVRLQTIKDITTNCQP